MFPRPSILTAVVALFVAQGLYAHPLGNLGISHHSNFRIDANRVELRYTLDYAEIPTFQELQKHRFAAQPGHVTLTIYLSQLRDQLRTGLKLSLNGRPAALESAQPCEASFPDGAAGMQTMRVVCAFVSTLPAGETSFSLHYQDTNYPQRSGWKEIILSARPGIVVTEQSVPLQDRSAALTRYPNGLTDAPPQVLTAKAMFKKTPAQAN